jgi:hypothetical protein
LRILGHGNKAAVRRQPRRLHSLWYFDAAKDSDMVFYRIRVGTRNLAGDRIEPLFCLANRFPKKSKARLLALSEKLQFPRIGDTRGATMLEKQIGEIR